MTSAGAGSQVPIEIDAEDLELVRGIDRDVAGLQAKLGAMRASYVREERVLLERIGGRQEDLRRAAGMIAAKKKLTGGWDLDLERGTLTKSPAPRT